MPVEMFRSPFDKLRQKFNETDLRCDECGYVNPKGSWQAVAAGSHVHYQRVCLSCGVIETRVVQLK